MQRTADAARNLRNARDRQIGARGRHQATVAAGTGSSCITGVREELLERSGPAPAGAIDHPGNDHAVSPADAQAHWLDTIVRSSRSQGAVESTSAAANGETQSLNATTQTSSSSFLRWSTSAQPFRLRGRVRGGLVRQLRDVTAGRHAASPPQAYHGVLALWTRPGRLAVLGLLRMLR